MNKNLDMTPRERRMLTEKAQTIVKYANQLKDDLNDPDKDYSMVADLLMLDTAVFAFRSRLHPIAVETKQELLKEKALI